MCAPAPNHFLFDPIERWSTLTLKTCQQDDTAETIAQRMQALGVSSLLVEAEGRIVGIVTDRDLRNKVVGAGLAPQVCRAAELMAAPLITLPRSAPLHQALFLMARQGIHRVVVSDEKGEPIGILSQSDLLKTQRHSPHWLALEIERATKLPELAGHYRAVAELVTILVNSHTPIEEVVALIAFLNDAIMRRLVEITAEAHAFPLEHFAFVVLGSQGRSEQTLVTDQDNAIIFEETLDPKGRAAARALGEAISEGLLAVGFPPCPGNIMTRNPAWCRSAEAWQQQISAWVRQPTPDHVLNVAMVADLRTLAGNDGLTARLRETLYREAREHSIFLARLAQNSLRFAPPLGWFGRIKTSRHGAIKHGIDLKKAGIFAITDGVRTLSLQHQTLEAGNTFQRLAALNEKGVVAEKDAYDLTRALEFLLALRLRAQLQAIARSEAPSNVVDFRTLGRLERFELRAALQTVQRFQSFLHLHFHLDLLRN